MTEQELMALAVEYCNRAEIPQDEHIRAGIKALFRRNNYFGGLVRSGEAQNCPLEEQNGRFVFTWPD